MAFKIDLSKAFDSLEWGFIHDTLVHFQFPQKMIKLILSCITTSQISVLWNGEITTAFTPSRGIRQGDPLSPYIFVPCMERLSELINQRVHEGSWVLPYSLPFSFVLC